MTPTGPQPPEGEAPVHVGLHALSVPEARAHLLSLGEGWDSYGARPVDEATLDRAIAILRMLRLPPIIVPTCNGEIQLEWHGWGWGIEILFTRDGEVVAVVERD